MEYCGYFWNQIRAIRKLLIQDLDFFPQSIRNTLIFQGCEEPTVNEANVSAWHVLWDEWCLVYWRVAEQSASLRLRSHTGIWYQPARPWTYRACVCASRRNQPALELHFTRVSFYLVIYHHKSQIHVSKTLRGHAASMDHQRPGWPLTVFTWVKQHFQEKKKKMCGRFTWMREFLMTRLTSSLHSATSGLWSSRFDEKANRWDWKYSAWKGNKIFIHVIRCVSNCVWSLFFVWYIYIYLFQYE